MASYRYKSGDALLLLLLLLPGTLTIKIPTTSRTSTIEVVVQNDITPVPEQKYDATLPYRAILLSGLNALMESDVGFNFTYRDDPNYGAFLESVNGVAASQEEQTYWELLVKEPSGQIRKPDVGIKCYIPRENEQIILKLAAS
ncbi:uncharacterized protein V6R79_004681 [Siganus canaliculatus]